MAVTLDVWVLARRGGDVFRMGEAHIRGRGAGGEPGRLDEGPGGQLLEHGGRHAGRRAVDHGGRTGVGGVAGTRIGAPSAAARGRDARGRGSPTPGAPIRGSTLCRQRTSTAFGLLNGAKGMLGMFGGLIDGVLD